MKNTCLPCVPNVRATDGARTVSSTLCARARRGLRKLAIPPLVAAMLSTGVVPLPAANYDVQHNFTLRPGGNVVPRVQAVYYAHAWATTVRPNCRSSAVVPGAGTQPLGWDPFGTDRLASQGTVRTRGQNGTVNATQGRVNVGAGGLPLTTWTADANGCPSARGQGNSSISVNPFGPGGPVRGTIRAHGFAVASAPPPLRSAAYAFSMAMVEAQGGRLMRNGQIRWGKVVRDVVQGQAGARRQVDPVDYVVQDLVTGERFEGTLYSVDVDITNSPSGGFIWESNKVTLSASNVTFHVQFPSPHTKLQGELRVQVRNGAVVNSVGTGFFAGMGAPVGARVPVTMAVPNEIDIDYDLGDHNGHDLDVNIGMHGAGEAYEEAGAGETLSLTITPLDSTTVQVDYPVTSTPWILESTPAFHANAPWLPVLTPPEIQNGRVIYRFPVADGVFPQQFFRLRLEDGGSNGDTTPPTFIAMPQCEMGFVMVHFSEPVDPASAMNPMHYRILAEIPMEMMVVGVQPVDPTTFMLMVNPPLLPGLPYVLMVSEVSDLAGNRVPEGTAVTFLCPQKPR